MSLKLSQPGPLEVTGSLWTVFTQGKATGGREEGGEDWTGGEGRRGLDDGEGGVDWTGGEGRRGLDGGRKEEGSGRGEEGGGNRTERREKWTSLVPSLVPRPAAILVT